MERLWAIVTEVKNKLQDKEQEMESAGTKVIPYLKDELKKRRHEVVSFELSLKKISANAEIKPFIVDQFKNDAQELILEINKIVI